MILPVLLVLACGTTIPGSVRLAKTLGASIDYLLTLLGNAEMSDFTDYFTKFTDFSANST